MILNHLHLIGIGIPELSVASAKRIPEFDELVGHLMTGKKTYLSGKLSPKIMRKNTLRTWNHNIKVGKNFFKLRKVLFPTSSHKNITILVA